MTIATNVFRARRDYVCVECHKLITKGSRYTSMFGMADSGDRPYRIKICQNCKPVREDKVNG